MEKENVMCLFICACAVVKVTVLLSDIADWPKVNTIYQKCV